MKVLVANIGSTSFKFRLFELGEEERVLARGGFERIGQAGSSGWVEARGTRLWQESLPLPGYGAAIDCMFRALARAAEPVLGGAQELDAVGFKAVHARGVTGAVLVDDAVLAAMEEYAPLAPAHNPPYIEAMRSFAEAAPRVPRVALFETAPYAGMAPAARAYGVPAAWRERYGFQRYGFHGASHTYVAGRLGELLGAGATRYMISCHLGGSSSLTAYRDGTAVDTSMGMSPQSGLPQNNRVGDVDLYGVLYVMEREGLTIEGLRRVLASEGGLRGLSGGRNDMRDLAAAAAAGDDAAALARDVFVHSARHYLGALLLELGALDALAFTGGIGENDPDLRAAICGGLEGLIGLRLDAARNAGCAGREARISADASAVEVWVVPTNEELVVARAARRLLEQGRAARDSRVQ